MTEQIDNLLTPRVMVTNPWPGGSYHKGKVLSGAMNGGRIRVNNSRRTTPTDMTAAGLCAKFPGNFREMHWAEGRELDQLPEYIKYPDGEVIKVAQWKYTKHSEKAVAVDASDEHFWSTSALPATSAQYLEYLTQQSKG